MYKNLNGLKQAACMALAMAVLSLISLNAWSQSAATTAPSVSKTVKTAATAPDELNAFAGGVSAWRMQGTGALRFFGFKAYDAMLWSTGAAGSNTSPLLNKSLFALEIVYNTSLTSDEIVNVSLLEMARLKRLTDAQRKAWTSEMTKFFPSVKSGDRLTGVYVPKLGTRFFFNGKLISEMNDVAFGDAFFAIWLDEGAKKPDLRRALLGLPALSSGASMDKY
jgi:Chalcone isomerase-like